MREHERIFESYLQSRGLKNTIARKLVLTTVFSLHEHFDIEQLYDLIRQISRNVSRATVYRTIPLLAEAGLVQRSVRSESRDTFEHIFGHPKHAHWVCKDCGAVLETNLQEIFTLLQDKASRLGFQPEEISLEIKGLCRKCRKAQRAKK